MNKATTKRLAELKKQKEDFGAYREQHSKEFGPTADELLDFLHDHIVKHLHMEISLTECECGGGCSDMLLQTDDMVTGTDMRDLIEQMMKEAK